MFGIDWEEMGTGAQQLRHATGATIMLLQEGTAIAHGLAHGWDCLWRAERSMENLIVLNIEHMRDSDTLGRLTFAPMPVEGSAILRGVSTIPGKQPILSAEQKLLLDRLLAATCAANDHTLSESDFYEIAREANAAALRSKDPKHANERIRRWLTQFEAKSILRRDHNGRIVLKPRWRSYRLYKDLDDAAELLSEMREKIEAKDELPPPLKRRQRA